MGYEMKHTILVKDVKKFVKEHLVTYASSSGDSKRFLISTHAAPNVERYIVIHATGKKGFTKVGDAVRFYNSI